MNCSADYDNIENRVMVGQGDKKHWLPVSFNESFSSVSPLVWLKIMTIPNSEIKFKIWRSDTVASVKLVIQLMTGISMTHQQLHYSGNTQGIRLLDDRTMESYNIKSGHILSLVLSLTGGPPMIYFGPTNHLYMLGDEPKLLSVSLSRSLWF